MRKCLLMLIAVAVISSCSVENKSSSIGNDVNKVAADKDANYKKSLDFLDSKGVVVTEFFPKILISIPANIIFKPDTAILYSDAMPVVRSLATFMSKYQHSAIQVTASAVTKKESYLSYAVAHNQGEKIIELLTKYGDYSFIGSDTKLIMEDEIFNDYYAAGKYFIDIELSL